MLPHPDLVVLSHLRWSGVWQRPHHLISRLARTRRTWFVEEPIVADVERPRLRWDRSGDVIVVRLEVPGEPRHVGFDAPESATLQQAVADAAGGTVPLVWLYTPLALPMAQALRPELLVYDVMDDLSAFRGASPEMRDAQYAALTEADVVFAGGRSLHASVAPVSATQAHLFPSGVEREHFRRTALRPAGERPVAGYVGVIDERLDLELLGDMADSMPDWDVRIVGPVAKIEPETLPRRPNLSYPGAVAYDDLPDVLAGFDVAIMPFALNDATRAISPTKTLEYLAAGLPIASTRVPDVVADFGSIVRFCDDGRSFASVCRQLRGSAEATTGTPAVEAMLRRHDWDLIALRMQQIIDETAIELVGQLA